MSTVVYKSGTKTATGTTDTYTFQDLMVGDLLKVEITCSAATDFKMYTLGEDGSTVDEYILGGAASTLTVASSTKLNPGTPFNDTDGSVFSGSNYAPFVITRNKLKVDASNIATDDTWSIELIMRR